MDREPFVGVRDVVRDVDLEDVAGAEFYGWAGEGA